MCTRELVFFFLISTGPLRTAEMPHSSALLPVAASEPSRDVKAWEDGPRQLVLKFAHAVLTTPQVETPRRSNANVQPCNAQSLPEGLGRVPYTAANVTPGNTVATFSPNAPCPQQRPLAVSTVAVTDLFGRQPGSFLAAVARVLCVCRQTTWLPAWVC